MPAIRLLLARRLRGYSVMSCWRWSLTPGLLIAGLSSLALLLLDHTVAPGVAMPLWDIPSALVLLALVPWLAGVAVVWQRLRWHHAWPEAWRIARESRVSTPALVSLAVGVLLIRVLLVNAVAWKYGIPLLGGFQYDPAFHRADLALVGGEAWTRLSWLLTWPALWAVDRFYAFWYAAFVFVVIREAWRPPDGRQRRFFTAMALTWVLGSILAVLLPSAGPVYFALVTGHPAYQGLTAALSVHPLLATKLERDLWLAYANGGGGLVKGIAAFPSLHVAMPALYAVSTWSRARSESVGWWGFTAMTLAASVVLGWHYAVDGYVAVLGVLAIWWLAARRPQPPHVPSNASRI